MEDTTREILRQIDETMHRNFTCGGELTTVLSALRGPDFDIHGLWFLSTTERALVKPATTGLVRHHALPHHPYTTPTDNETYLRIRQKLDTALYSQPPLPLGVMHFITHAKQAFQALGLNWNELNPPGPTENSNPPQPQSADHK